MTPLEGYRLTMYQRLLGPMNSEQALEEVADIEGVLGAITPNDPSWLHFKQQQQDYENYAVLILKSEAHTVKRTIKI